VKARQEGFRGELQIHSRAGARPVRTVRITRWRLRALGLFAVVALGYLGALAVLVPRATQIQFGGRSSSELARDRTRLGEALRASVESLQAIERRTDDVARRMDGVRRGYSLQGPAVGSLPERDLVDLGDSIYATLARRADGLIQIVGRKLDGVEQLLAGAERYEAVHPQAARFVPSSSPLRGGWVLVSAFAGRVDPYTQEVVFHPAIDLAAAAAAPIHAPADGTVLFAGVAGRRLAGAWKRLGKLIVLRHGEEWISILGHLEMPRVERGDRVSRGQVVAAVGNSGWTPTPRLHYEVRRADAAGIWEPVDPWFLLLDADVDEESQLIVSSARNPAAPFVFEPLPAAFLR
jgi:murein DD-endopeptidase MepM/ murein hydrolase activator NlpD